jgi:uncharacterized protein (TIGR02217 family)
MPNFHDVRFPVDVARGARGGPGRRTDIVTLASGREYRNARWSQSRRTYDAGYGVKSLDTLHAILVFFEERRGRLHGFRWRDRVDCASGLPSEAVTPTDQRIGTGDGSTSVFQLVKTYGGDFAPYVRAITKPVAGSVRIAVNGIEKTGAAFACDFASGLVTFAVGQTPPPGSVVTAGYQFDVPVRFDSDMLDIDLSAFAAGEIPKIPLVEIVE